MKWRSGRRSQNIEDRRSHSVGASGRTRRMGSVKKGGGLSIIVIVLVVWLMGGDLNTIMSVLMGEGAYVPSSTQTSTNTQAPASHLDNERADFVSVVLADTEDTWGPLFKEQGWTYQEPSLVMFRNAVQSACGSAQSAMGPFYCPGDRKVYIDLGFYDDLAKQFGAPGDFAQAYVIAHEVGHHVQQELGILKQVQNVKRNMGQVEANALQVKVELQADCFAGIWAHYADRARSLLEEGDLEEAMNAASQIGDDAIQKRSRGYVVPDSFTHGTSKQRQLWFGRGYKSGSIEACNTFDA
jgi:predicted metalloprotease